MLSVGYFGKNLTNDRWLVAKVAKDLTNGR